MLETAALGLESRQNRIDIRDILRVVLLLELVKQLDKDASENRGIFARAVMLKRSDLQRLGKHIQLDLCHVREQDARHLHRVNRGEFALNPQTIASLADERHIKSGVVRHERQTAGKIQKRRERFGQLGRLAHGLIRNAGQLGDVRRNRLVRIDIGLKFVDDLAVADLDRGDFRDLLAVRTQTGGLGVKADKGLGQRRVVFAAHDGDRLAVVDIVRLDAVQHLEVDFVALDRVHRVRKRLRTAVVGDRNRGVSPLLRALHQLFHRRDAVHCGHIGVHVQFHALVLAVVHAHLLRALENTRRFHDGFLHVVVVGDLALHGQIHAVFDQVDQLARLVRRDKFADADRTGQVGDVKADFHPLSAVRLALDLLVINEKYLAADRDTAH